MRTMGGGESYESSPNLGCASFKRQRLRGADMGVETKKNKGVSFLIKAALKERVGVLGGRGGGGGHQAESFLYTHFLWLGHFGSGQQGEIMCLVYAILPHFSSHSMHSHMQSYYTYTPVRTYSNTSAYMCSMYICTCVHRHTVYMNLYLYGQWHTQ